jgi:hypothetical protein
MDREDPTADLLSQLASETLVRRFMTLNSAAKKSPVIGIDPCVLGAMVQKYVAIHGNK